MRRLDDDDAFSISQDDEEANDSGKTRDFESQNGRLEEGIRAKKGAIFVEDEQRKMYSTFCFLSFYGKQNKFLH